MISDDYHTERHTHCRYCGARLEPSVVPAGGNGEPWLRFGVDGRRMMVRVMACPTERRKWWGIWSRLAYEVHDRFEYTEPYQEEGKAG